MTKHYCDIFFISLILISLLCLNILKENASVPASKSIVQESERSREKLAPSIFPPQGSPPPLWLLANSSQPREGPPLHNQNDRIPF